MCFCSGDVILIAHLSWTSFLRPGLPSSAVCIAAYVCGVDFTGVDVAQDANALVAIKTIGRKGFIEISD
jgi:hypothetical protein